LENGSNSEAKNRLGSQVKAKQKEEKNKKNHAKKHNRCARLGSLTEKKRLVRQPGERKICEKTSKPGPGQSMAQNHGEIMRKRSEPGTPRHQKGSPSTIRKHTT